MSIYHKRWDEKGKKPVILKDSDFTALPDYPSSNIRVMSECRQQLGKLIHNAAVVPNRTHAAWIAIDAVFDKCICVRTNHWCRSLWLAQGAKFFVLRGIESRKELAQIQGHSCYKDTIHQSDVPFPSLTSMLLSVLIAKSNRGIPNVTWMNIDT